jgi:hypothetical protein
MSNSFEITVESNFIRVQSYGRKDIEFATDLWTQMVKTCNEDNCFRVLGISDTTVAMEAIDGYEHARLFEDLGIGPKYRIAWVELNEKARDMTIFIETVLINRGLPGRLFDGETEAKAWLLGD